jgi:hypothetical protein
MPRWMLVSSWRIRTLCPTYASERPLRGRQLVRYLAGRGAPEQTTASLAAPPRRCAQEEQYAIFTGHGQEVGRLGIFLRASRM